MLGTSTMGKLRRRGQEFAAMKALSIRQPWASLIILGVKTIETRPWRTAYRGDLAIHASKTFGRAERRMAQAAVALPHLTLRGLDPDALPRGIVLGVVELVDCVPADALGDLVHASTTRATRERMLGDYRAGRFGWLLRDPRPFAQPVAALGKLMLWDFPCIRPGIRTE